MALSWWLVPLSSWEHEKLIKTEREEIYHPTIRSSKNGGSRASSLDEWWDWISFVFSLGGSQWVCIVHVSSGGIPFNTWDEGCTRHSRHRLWKHLGVRFLEAEPEMEYLCKTCINGALWWESCMGMRGAYRQGRSKVKKDVVQPDPLRVFWWMNCTTESAESWGKNLRTFYHRGRQLSAKDSKKGYK